MRILKLIWRRLSRDWIDTIMIVLMISMVVSWFVKSSYYDYSKEGIAFGDWTPFLAVFALWGFRLMMWYSRTWELIDKHVTDNKIRREVFHLGPYDEPPRKVRLNWFEYLVRIIITAGGMLLIGYVVFSIIFL